MAKVYEFLANGFEDIEALAPVDILRRGGLEVVTVSITGSEYVESAHGVEVKADVWFEDVESFDDADLLLLPGGMPGAANLDMHHQLGQVLIDHCERGKLMGAICAAPLVLGRRGLLDGRHATCYPGFEQYLDGAEITHELVTEDGNIITGEGPAAAFEYGYRLLARFVPAEDVEALKEGMRYKHLMGKSTLN